MISLYGVEGQSWLNALPKLVEHVAHIWNLSGLKPLNSLSYHYLLTGLQNNRSIILKIGFDRDSLKREENALLAFKGYGCVKLIQYNNDLGVLLMEEVLPGTPLKVLFPKQEQESIQIASQVIKRLHTAFLPKNNSFVTLEHWLSILDQEWDVPEIYLKKARSLSRKLLRGCEKNVLLHGDLHHDNILSSQENSWLVIDPKGIVGDQSFEVASFIRNPLPELLEQSDLKNLIENRIQSFSKYLNIREERLRAWSYVHAVLSMCWMLEDNLDPQNVFELVKLFYLIVNNEV